MARLTRPEVMKRYQEALTYLNDMSQLEACEKVGISISSFNRMRKLHDHNGNGADIKVITHDAKPEKRTYNKKPTKNGKGKAIVIVTSIDSLPDVLEKLR